MTALQLSDQQVLQPYLPRLLTQWLADTPDLTHREIEGSFTFIDISGFTRLSESLAKKGKVGAEELSEAIGSCFTRLLGVAYGNGGGLIKFGGDALLLLFRGEQHEQKACRAAIGMRRALKEIGALACSGGRVTLRMSVGVHSGVFNMFLVGDSHKELVLAGPAVTETVLMENMAEAGEILVSPATAAMLPAGVLGIEKGPGTLLRREPRGLSAEIVDTDGALGVPILDCIPLAVREHLLAGIESPEHKRVTVAFVHFDGTDELIATEGPAAAARALDVLVRDVQRAADRQEICFLGTDIDRDGGKIILSAGAPTAHENDEERMLLALREIADGERQIPIRIGVNRGPVFAGDIGPRYRRTYTVMGDAVNVAARLMAKADPGTILATEAMVAASRTHFETTALAPLTVKGKSKPINAVAVGSTAGVRERSDTQPRPLIGRDAEMQILRDALASARAGKGRLVELIGEPGIGKSRLMEALAEDAADAFIISSVCEPYEASNAYFAFRAILRRALGIPDDAIAETAGLTLLDVLAGRAPQLLPWSPLLAIVIDAMVPATKEAQALESEFKRARLEQAAIDLLTIVLDRTTLIEIEDGQWMDEASAELLSRLARNVDQAPWIICLSRRDVGTGFAAKPGPNAAQIRLQPLDGAAAAALLNAATEDAPLSPHEIAALAERSGGNPLFLTELVAAARSAGGIDELPDSIEAVITARIDRMPPQDRMRLRYLSVLGPSFTASTAAAILTGGKSAPLARLGEFILPEGNDTYRFRNALIRDAAYEGLPYRLRRQLHATVGEMLESSSSTEDLAEILSFHFFQARRFDRAWRYSRTAGDRARAVYANTEAAEFYVRALESVRGLDSADRSEIIAVYESLGDVRQVLGEFARAAEAYRRARLAFASDPVVSARLILKEAVIKRLSGKYADAIRTLRRANKEVAQIETVEAAAQRAQIAVAYAGVFRQQGKPARVVAWCRRAIDDALRANDRDALAHAYFLLDLAYVEMGRWADAVHSDEALAIYEELGDLAGQGVVLNNLGVKAYWHGRWDEAIEFYERGRIARQTMGDAVYAALGTLNIGEILIDQGRLGDAEPLIKEALRVWKAAEFRSGMAHALRYLGRIASRAGNYDDASSLFAEAREVAEEAGGEMDVIETDTRIVESLVLQGRGAEAELFASETLARATSAAAAEAHVVVLHRLRGWARLQRCDFEGARADFDESLRGAQARNSDYELALTLRALACLSEMRGDDVEKRRAEEFHATSKLILKRLGVVHVFEPCPN